MDPIHPIIPQPPNIPPVTPAPTAGRIDREGKRQSDEWLDKRRRRRAVAGPPNRADEGARGDTRDDHDDDEPELGAGPHIDVTA